MGRPAPLEDLLLSPAASWWALQESRWATEMDLQVDWSRQAWGGWSPPPGPGPRVMTAGETGPLEADREVVVGFRLRIGCTHRKAWSRPSDSGRLPRQVAPSGSVIHGCGSWSPRERGGAAQVGAGLGVGAGLQGVRPQRQSQHLSPHLSPEAAWPGGRLEVEAAHS